MRRKPLCKGWKLSIGVKDLLYCPWKNFSDQSWNDVRESKIWDGCMNLLSNKPDCSKSKRSRTSTLVIKDYRTCLSWKSCNRSTNICSNTRSKQRQWPKQINSPNVNSNCQITCIRPTAQCACALPPAFRFLFLSSWLQRNVNNFVCKQNFLFIG